MRQATADVADRAQPAEFDVVIVGAGFAGLYLLHRVRRLGLSVVLLDAASGLGGIWHWNCYPGARVDSHVPVYEYSAEEIWRDWYWDERFPDWQALRCYFDHVDAKWDLSRDIRLETRVSGASWDEVARRWHVRTDRGESFLPRFFVLCTGFAAKAYIPDFPGLQDFEGECHHTSQWPQSGVDLENRRIGVIGTGASGVQVIQEAYKVASHLTVFQRTPIMALAMQQKRLTKEEQDAAKAEYPQIFRARRETNAGFDLVPAGDSTFAITEQEREAVYERLWATGGFSFWAGNFSDVFIDHKANRAAYDFWRKKVIARLDDPETAELLAPADPPHPFGVKRPSLEQDYYEAFNQPNVELIDVGSNPIDRITPAGVHTADGRQHDLDLLVFATGFDAVTGGLTSLDIVGSGGGTLRDHWREGLRTHLGMASSGFPNLFYIYGPQSPAGFCNGPTCAEVQGDWLLELLDHLGQTGADRIEALPEAEEAWRAQVDAIASMTLFPEADSWYMGANVPGKRREMLNWPGGLQLYIANCVSSSGAGYSGFRIERPATVGGGLGSTGVPDTNR